MGTYSIKELEQLSGIKAHTIRIWEQRYGLIEPTRTDTNIRLYDDEQLKFMLNVALLQRHGYKISQISRWTRDEFLDKVQHLYEGTLLLDPTVHLDLDANDLVTAMIDMDELKFNRIYDSAVRRYGFEDTIMQLIYPFLDKVGMLWSINQVNPAHEHFISCLIRQKIISAIDQLELAQSSKRFLLFLPEGEQHEIGLLLSHYLLKQRGARVIYLGQNLPEADIASSILTVNPDYILTFLVDASMVRNAERISRYMSECSPHAQLLIACRPDPSLDVLRSDRVHFLNRIDDLKQYVQAG